MRDGALLGFGQRFDAFELLLNLLLRPALLLRGAGCGVAGDQRIEHGLQRLRDHLEHRYRHAAVSLLERVHGLLGVAELFGEFDLGDALGFMAFGDASAMGHKKCGRRHG